MGREKLLGKLGDFFDMNKKKRIKNAKELKALLKLLKQEEKKQIELCGKESSENKRKMINREIAVLHAKRKKGLKALKQLLSE
jgi:hypothetical protein